MIAIFIWKKMAGIAMAVLLCISSLGAKPVESLPVLGENTKKAAAAAENLARGENVFRQGREETPQEYPAGDSRMLQDRDQTAKTVKAGQKDFTADRGSGGRRSGYTGTAAGS